MAYLALPDVQRQFSIKRTSYTRFTDMRYCLFGTSRFQISVRGPHILTTTFCGFPQSLLPTARQCSSSSLSPCFLFRHPTVRTTQTTVKQIRHPLVITRTDCFLGPFAKLQRATISLVMSVRPYGATWLLLDGFS